MTIFSTPTDRASRTSATISRGARCEVPRIAPYWATSSSTSLTSGRSLPFLSATQIPSAWLRPPCWES